MKLYAQNIELELELEQAKDDVDMLVQHLKKMDKSLLEYHNGVQVNRRSITQFMEIIHSAEESQKTNINNSITPDIPDNIESNNNETFIKVKKKKKGKKKKGKEKGKNKNKGMNFMMGMLSTGNESSDISNGSLDNQEGDGTEDDSNESSHPTKKEEDFGKAKA